jgi:glycosyltransferase involved in cell wall biosynthesis
MRLRIAVVYHFFPHYRKAVVSELAREGTCDWMFFGDTHDFHRESGIPPMTFPGDVRFERLKVTRIRGSLMWQHGVMGLAVSRQCDVLILLGDAKFPSMWAAAALGRLTGKRVLFWTHGWTYRPRGIARVVRRTFYRLAHGLMTYGRWAKQIAIDEGFDPSRVYVIGNSLDLADQKRALEKLPPGRRDEVRSELFGNSTIPIVACISRLTAVRRLDMLLNAVARLRESGTVANVLLIGEGPERQTLQSLAEKLLVPVAFEGACYDEARICELMAATNVVVAPGKVGLTAMHSMAYGIPVVTHDDYENQMPEFEAVLPGRTGSLFRLGDTDSLASAIKPWLLSRYVDPGVSETCKSIVTRFWSASFQRKAIMQAVRGKPANDLETTKGGPL